MDSTVQKTLVIVNKGNYKLQLANYNNYECVNYK